MTDARRALEVPHGAADSRRRFLGRAGAGLRRARARRCSRLRRRRGRRGGGRRPAAVNHPKTPIGNWTFSNWPLYIDKKVIKIFDKKLRRHFKYLEDINDNDEFFGKVRQQLQASQPIGRDIMTLTDYMAARCAPPLPQPIDKTNTPELRQEPRRQPASDLLGPGPRVLAPWQSGAVGLGYNIKKTGRELNSVKDLFDPKFKGRVTMLSEAYDSAEPSARRRGSTPRRRRSTRSSGRSRRSARPTTPASSAASPATTTRPTSPRATCGSRSPTRAT